MDQEGGQVRAPKGQGALAKLDYGIYQVERGIVWLALSAMVVAYALNILERELTAGPGQNAIERFILARLGQTSETVDPSLLARLHAFWAPLVAAIGTLGLLLIAAFTRKAEGGTRTSRVVRFFVAAILGAAACGVAAVYLPSRWVLTAVIAGIFTWAVLDARKHGRLARTLTIFGPVAALLVWFVFAHIRSGYTWSKELSMVLLMWVGFIGASMATFEGRNIQIDFIRKSVPRGWLRGYEAVSSLVTAIFTAILAALAWHTVRKGMAQEVLLPNVDLAEYFVPMPIALAFILIAVRYVARTIFVAAGVEKVPGDAATPEHPRRFVIVAGSLAAVAGLGFVMFPADGAWIFATLVGLIICGAPLFVVLGAVAVACFAAVPQVADYFESFEAFNQNFNLMARMRDLADQESMIAIPFFMIAGAIMSRGAIAQQLVNVATAAFGWMPGGLAVSTVAACAFFAAISGSSPVTVITIGAVMYPALIKAGYAEKFSLGLVTSAGSLGIIIPPSIPMIIFAIIATLNGTPVDIQDLFIAGVLPGVFIATILVSYCIFWAKLNGQSIPRVPFSLKRLGQTFLQGFWALFLPAVILFGIYFGIFNAIEAAAIAVVVALLVELFINRQLSLRELPALMADSASLMGSLLVIISVALGLSEFFTIRQIPERLVDWLASFQLSPIGFMLLLNVLLLIVGSLMDVVSAIILFVPLIIPLANALDFSPIHLALIFIVNLEIGYLTPPVGLNLFVSASYFQKSFGLVMRSVVPFIAAMVVSLVGIVAWPGLSVGLANLMHGKPAPFSVAFPSGKRLEARTEVAGAPPKPSSFITASVATPPEAAPGDPAAPVEPPPAPKMDLRSLTDRSRSSEVEATGDLSDFDKRAVRAFAVKDGGKHTRTVVVMTTESKNCGPEGSAPPDEDEWLLRIELPAGAAKDTVYDVNGKDVSVTLVKIEGGKVISTMKPDTGLVVVLDPEKPETIAVMDPANEGQTLGLFGAFELKFGAETFNGKFVPSPCEEGSPLFK